MSRRISIVLAAGLLGCGERVAAPEGVYTMCRDVAGYSGETIELKDGKFRYWFYSDAGSDGGPYPLTGTYRVSGDKVILDEKSLSDSPRTIATINGIPVLWRQDGLQLYEKEGRFQPYAVLLKVDGAVGDIAADLRPSLDLLKSAKLRESEKKEYEERYHDQPPGIRALLRARSLRGDPDLAVYAGELQKAREALTPSLIRELIAYMGGNVHQRIEGKMILEDLYNGGWLRRKDASFPGGPNEKRRALGFLIDGLDAARDRHSIEETLLVFLGASGVRTMDLSIPEAGVRIRLEIHPSGYSRGSEWTDALKLVVPAVQKWMRAQLAK